MYKVRQAFYAAFIRSLLRTKSVLQTILNLWLSPSVIKSDNINKEGGASESSKRIAEFLKNVDDEFRRSKEVESLVALSNGLREQFGRSLLTNPLCMLPSYNHQLPHGNEKGTYLALDVGGSTFRVALIELCGKESQGSGSVILKRDTFKISSDVKQLKGVLFFDWMAKRMGEVLSDQNEGHNMTKAPLSMGMSWSFPIE